MKRICSTVFIALGLTHFTPVPLPAQIRWGPYVGVLMPINDYGDVDKTGWIAGLGVTKWLPGGMLGVRVDGSYSQTAHDEAVTLVSGNTKIIGGMASAVFALAPAEKSIRPVVTGGIGFYSVDDGTATESKVAFGGGLALLFKLGLSSTRLVIATRYTSVTTDPSVNFVPITVGLSLGK